MLNILYMIRGAISYYKRLILYESDQVNHWNNLGYFSVNIGEFEDAKYYYSHALKLSPKNSKILLNIAILYKEVYYYI